MQGAGGDRRRSARGRVAVASTGVIGVPLPMHEVNARDRAAPRARSAPTATPTSRRRSRPPTRSRSGPAWRSTLRRRGRSRLTAQAKGAGMISPGFATLLCFVQTDAALSAETCDLLLGVCVKRSFERVSVDGQLSTSDTVILQCSGESEGCRRARDRGRAALRRGAGRAPAPARATGRPRRRGRAAGGPGGRARRGPGRRGRPSRGRWPTPRWSRRRSTAAIPTGAGSSRPWGRRCPERRRWRSTSRSRASRCAPGGGLRAPRRRRAGRRGRP